MSRKFLSLALYVEPLLVSIRLTHVQTRVGKLISRHCSDGLKKLTLELGGNCPFLVFDDANLTQARDGKSWRQLGQRSRIANKFVCSALMALKFRHAGQACITANRVYVQRGVYEKFGNMLADAVGQLKVGHGMDKGTTMGPVTVPAGLDKVAGQIKDAVEKGATVLTGGEKINKNGGYFFQPTIIQDAAPGMLVAEEETFGPLLAMIPFDSEEEVVEAANKTSVSSNIMTV